MFGRKAKLYHTIEDEVDDKDRNKISHVDGWQLNSFIESYEKKSAKAGCRECRLSDLLTSMIVPCSEPIVKRQIQDPNK